MEGALFGCQSSVHTAPENSDSVPFCSRVGGHPSPCRSAEDVKRPCGRGSALRGLPLGVSLVPRVLPDTGHFPAGFRLPWLPASHSCPPAAGSGSAGRSPRAPGLPACAGARRALEEGRGPRAAAAPPQAGDVAPPPGFWVLPGPAPGRPETRAGGQGARRGLCRLLGSRSLVNLRLPQDGELPSCAVLAMLSRWGRRGSPAMLSLWGRRGSPAMLSRWGRRGSPARLGSSLARHWNRNIPRPQELSSFSSLVPSFPCCCTLSKTTARVSSTGEGDQWLTSCQIPRSPALRASYCLTGVSALQSGSSARSRPCSPPT
nr:uncharacterized protein LOC127488503 [Oryctolagus cuniculus]